MPRLQRGLSGPSSGICSSRKQGTPTPQHQSSRWRRARWYRREGRGGWVDEREPDKACVSLSETVSQRQAMSRLGFFFLPGAPPGRVLATCQEWRSEEKLVSRESKILSRVAATCHRTENGSFAAGRKVSFPGRVEAAARSGGGGCSVWRANNTRMPIGARLSRAERSRPCARVPREWPSNLTPGKHRDNRAVTQERVDSRPGSHPVDGRRPLSSTHAAALIRKRIAAVGAPSPP
jgi:hypothetical protein